MNASFGKSAFLAAWIALACAFAAHAAPWTQDELAQLDAALERIASYQLGEQSEGFNLILKAVNDSYGDTAWRERLNKRFVQLLANPQASFECKKFICRQLFVIGDESSVPALGKLINDDRLGHMARYALQRMPFESAGAALRQALGDSKGLNRVGIIDVLGARRDSNAVEAIAPMVCDGDARIARAAISALGKIGGVEAATLLAAARPLLEASLLAPAADSLLACAEGLARQDARERMIALAIYAQLFDSAEPAHIRGAALAGQAQLLGPVKARPLLADALGGGDAEARNAALRLARDWAAPQAASVFAGLFEAASEGNQAALLHALAARNDPAMLPAFLKGLQAKEAAARIAAVQALEFCADASMVVPLASMAASADPAEQSAARQALERVSFQNADQAILAAIDGAAPAVRLELIRVLGVRRAEEGLPLLRAACLWEDAAIRLQAIKSLGELGGESEAAVLIEAMLSAANAEERDAAGVALAAVCRRIEPANRRAAPILGALAIHTDAPSRQSLLSALGRIGAGEGLGALRQAAQTGDMDTRKIAVRALADWPGAAPLFTLMDIAKKSDDTVLRVLALRGCAAQLAMPDAMPPDAKADLYAAAIGLLDSAEEIVRFLPGLGAVRSARALALAEELMKNPDLKQEATLARNSIRKLLDAAIDVSASVNSDKAALAIDGKRETRWTTGASQAPGQWFQIDLKEPRAIEALALDAGDQGNDSPTQYEVYVFLDKAAIGKPAASGQSKGKTLAIPLAGAEGRFILIKQMGALKNYWSIAELKIEFSQK